MSVIPAFELGFWNAWLLMLYVIFYNVLPYVFSFMRPLYKEILKKGSGPDIPLSKKEKSLGNILSIVFFIPIVYSFFLPLTLFSIWFYVGFIVYLFGVCIGSMAMYDFYTTEVDKLVTKGVYRVSRNPMYLGIFLIYIGTGIAAGSCTAPRTRCT